MGTAAYKTVELDDLLGDLPVQYREVQGAESDAFLAVFNNQISLLKGGIDSGFKKVEEMKWPTRLLHLKGTKQIRVCEVAPEVKSLNHGDAFLLDMGLNIFQWNGKSAGIAEKRKAAAMIETLKKERNGKAKSSIIDGVEENKVFWEALGQAGGAPPTEASIAAATSDDIPVIKRKDLYELSDKTGSLVKTKVASGSDVKKSQLKTDEVFILDVGESVYAWIGKGASKAERSKGIEFASKHVADSGLPANTGVSRVMEGAEPAAFLAWL
jgi:villin 1/advillin